MDFKSVVPEMSNTELMVAEALPASRHSLYMTIAVLVRNRGNSNTIVRSSKKRRLTIATSTTTAVVKDEDELDVRNAAKSSHFSPDTVAAQEALLQATKVVIRFQ